MKRASFAAKKAVEKLHGKTQSTIPFILHQSPVKSFPAKTLSDKSFVLFDKSFIPFPIGVQNRFLCFNFSPEGTIVPSTSATVDDEELSISIQDSKDADLIFRLLMEHHNPYHNMEAALQLNGIGLSSALVYQVLLRLKNASKVALGFFVWAKEQAGYQHSTNTYNIMIDILGKVRQFDVAWQLIMELSQRSQVTVKSFAILIRRYIAANMTRQAVRAFDDMESFIERESNSEDFNMLLDTLCKYGFVKVATELFNKRKAQFPPDTKMYTILVYGWCKFEKPAMAKKFFNEMIGRGFDPSVVTYNILLNGICGKRKVYSEFRLNRMMRAAEKLLDQMKSRGCVPDVTTYSILMHALGRALKTDESFKLLTEMKENGCTPNIATYTSLVKCLCSTGRLNEAYKLLDEMAQNGVAPSAVTYNCFFKELGGRNNAVEALKLYQKMQEVSSSCKPTNHTYNILIGMFCRLNHMEVVFDLWNDMHQKGNGPDLDSYTLLIHNFCEKGMWSEACRFFVEMIEKGFLPQTVTFETLYRGLIQSDKVRSWRRLKTKLAEESEKFKEEYGGYHFKPYQR
eukprot:Gb_41835 [translate_table: standard]